MGAVSFAYCAECLKKHREPWGSLVGGLMGVGRGEEADWVKPIIQATLEFYGKSEDELWAEVEAADNEYWEAMKEPPKEEKWKFSFVAFVLECDTCGWKGCDRVTAPPPDEKDCCICRNDPDPCPDCKNRKDEVIL
jgi:hypothetical protein